MTKVGGTNPAVEMYYKAFPGAGEGKSARGDADHISPLDCQQGKHEHQHHDP